MTKRFAFRAIAGATLLCAAAFAAPALALTDQDRTEIRGMIREYLMENPEVIQDAMQELERRQQEAETKARAEALAQNKDLIYNSKRQVELGNPNGDVTLVEFFDYNCGYCKRALGDLNTLLARDPKLRVILKEFPVLGQGSVEAAQVAIAVEMQAPEKYLDFHRKLLGANGPVNKERALAVAREVGLDMTRLERDLGNPEVRATIEEVYQMANALGLTGTPTFIIGEAVIPGAVGVDQLSQRISAMRSCGKAAC